MLVLVTVVVVVVVDTVVVAVVVVACTFVFGGSVVCTHEGAVNGTKVIIVTTATLLTTSRHTMAGNVGKGDINDVYLFHIEKIAQFNYAVVKICRISHPRITSNCTCRWDNTLYHFTTVSFRFCLPSTVEGCSVTASST